MAARIDRVDAVDVDAALAQAASMRFASEPCVVVEQRDFGTLAGRLLVVGLAQVPPGARIRRRLFYRYALEWTKLR